MKNALLALFAATALSGVTEALTQATSLSLVNDGFREVRVSSTTEPEPPAGMLLVPGGEVIVGTELSRIEYLGDKDEVKIKQVMAEFPRHTAKVESFYIDRTEVTNLQWTIYLEATGREPSSDVVEYCWGGTTVPKGNEMLPISNVSFTEVIQYLAWAGKRLPTEDEWTMAARGPADDRDYPWGMRWDSKACRHSGITPASPSTVGSFPSGASPFGVLDMCGNVWEWVDSPFSAFDGFEPWRESKGKRSQIIAPDFDRSLRVAKGGSFANARNDSRIDVRQGLHPGQNDASLGFRAARSAEDGVDIITHAYLRLLPPSVQGLQQLDLNDVVAKEVTSYGHDGQVITGHRYLAFAHPAAVKGPGLSAMRKDARDDQITLGILSSSEPLEVPPLPPGDYLLTYKAKGESKAYKDKRREDKRSGGDKKKKEDEPPPPPPPSDGTEGDGNAPPGASAPWPGVNVAAIVEDIDFPQEKEVILFYNVNNAVVGFTLLPDVFEKDRAPASLIDKSDGKTWTIEYSHDNMPRNDKMPRFTIELKLFGEGLVD